MPSSDPINSTELAPASPPDIHSVRRDNLRALIRDFIDKQIAQGVPAKGIESVCAMHLGLSNVRLSQFKSKEAPRNMSDKVVQQIESLAGKPPGWLSKKHSESNIPTSVELAFLDLARAAWHQANAKGKRDLMRMAKRGFSHQDL